MHEPQQLHLLPDVESNQRKRRIKYVPPDIDLIRQYAYKVCRRLSERIEDPDCASTEYARDLTNFMQVVARIEARYRTQEVENGE